MEDEQFFKMGKAYLYGENGLGKDIGKACENFLKAAEAGNAESLAYYDSNCVAPDGGRMLQAIEKNGMQAEVPGLYIKALLLCGRTDVETQKTVLSYENLLKKGSDWLYFADYLDAVRFADGEKIKKCYLTAYVLAAQVTAKSMRDRMKKYGFTSTSADNFIVRDAQTLQCLFRADRFGTVKFLKKTIGTEMARAITEEKLSLFNKKIAEKLRAVQPEVITEYQRVHGSEDTVYGFSYSFKQEQSSSVTTHSGSGSMVIEKTYGTYKADFASDENFTEMLNNASYESEIPDERICLNDTYASCYADMLQNTTDALENLARSEVAKKYGWPSYSVETTVYHTDCDSKDETVSYFVPFYFFIYNLDGNTYTVRVNASSGKVHVFVNNPFGLATVKGGKTEGVADQKGKKKFSFGIFLVLTLFTGFGGLLYALVCLCKKD